MTTSFSIKDIASHCAEMEKKIEGGLSSFDAEFEALQRMSKTIQKEKYKSPIKDMDRYPNILPYQEDRVKLKDSEKSDYVNASHITDERTSYIAAQAPRPEAMSSFWQMIWEQGTSMILMLTKLTEGSTEKATVYWPPDFELEKGIVLGNFKIRNQTNPFREMDAILRRFELTPTVGEEKARTITHIQYTAWPDFGIPKDLRSYHHLMETCLPLLKEPISPVIHCSAGCGRTGVFIAIHQILMTKTEEIDILQVAFGLRQQRPGMIQSRDQYAFIFNYLQYRQSKGKCL